MELILISVATILYIIFIFVCMDITYKKTDSVFWTCFIDFLLIALAAAIITFFIWVK